MICGNGAAKREKTETVVGWENMPAEYQAGRDLQVVEVILEGGDSLIDDLYAVLWSDG